MPDRPDPPAVEATWAKCPECDGMNFRRGYGSCDTCGDLGYVRCEGYVHPDHRVDKRIVRVLEAKAARNA